MQWASARGNVHAVRKLLASGANPNVSSNFGQTPLHLINMGGNLDCATQLLCVGADPGLRSSDGAEPLHMACAYTKYQPLKPKVFEFLGLLFRIGANINSQTRNGSTGLHYAITGPEGGGNVPLKWLLDNGANPRLKTLIGSTILHQAGETEDLQTIEILRDAHLDKIDVYAKLNDSGETAMDKILNQYREYAASTKLIESFRLLLDEIEARTNGKPLVATSGVYMGKGSLGSDDTEGYNSHTMPGGFPLTSDEPKEENILPDHPCSVPETPNASPRPVDKFDDESEDEEHVFQDSPEEQIETTK